MLTHGGSAGFGYPRVASNSFELLSVNLATMYRVEAAH